MKVTEEEAKTKWCPLLAIGRALLHKDHHCVGARCMMWRSAEDRKPTGKDIVVDRPGGMKAIEKEWADLGFCGVAGKP